MEPVEVSRPNALSRVEIEGIIQGMTARDIFAVIPNAGETPEGGKVAGDAFEAAAERQGYGALALDRVSPADAIYLGQLLGEVFNQDSPKGEGTAQLPDSSDTGESTPSS